MLKSRIIDLLALSFQQQYYHFSNLDSGNFDVIDGWMKRVKVHHHRLNL